MDDQTRKTRSNSKKIQADTDSMSAANAIKHGLAAAKHLPGQIRHRSEEIFERLAVEQHPKTELERLLLQDVARRGAFLEFAQHCEISALVVGGRNAQKVADATASGLSDGEEIEVGRDDFLAAAISSDFLEKLNRYRRSHENGFCRALNYLGMITASRNRQIPRQLTVEDVRLRFPDSDSCVQYLISRSQTAEWQCPRCDKRSARHWLKKRLRWECGDCGAQVGLRHGTAMERSSIPLQKWFWAILLLCSNFETSNSQIAEALGLNRIATAKRLRQTVEAAIQSVNSQQLLVGLPALVVRMMESPESSVDSGGILRNENMSGPIRLEPAKHDTTRS